MSHITKIAVIETTNAIWEYDPEDPDNRVLGGGLDVIATIRTLAIKVRNFISISLFIAESLTQIQASGQRIQKFESIQIECDITTPLKITLHSNTHWGSAFGMLDRAYKLRVVSSSFRYHDVMQRLIESC
jgi:hypothetical protein